NVKSLTPGRNHVWLVQASRSEIRDSYFYGVASGGGSLSYGIDLYMRGDSLVINNVFHHITSAILAGTTSGDIIAYNFATDMPYGNPDWMQFVLNTHNIGNTMLLFEGNQTNGFAMDLFHGGDPLARSAMLRRGHYDAATGTVQWLASEIPTSGGPFVNDNPGPAKRDVPASLFLEAKPAAWWGTPWGAPPWPPVGPDVVGGQDAGHVHKNPARLCYENTPKDDHGVLTFNAATCYAGSPGSLPSARPAAGVR